MSTDINWHPLTPDVVFEDGVRYLIKIRDQPKVEVCEFIEQGGYFYAYNVGISTPYITHYARVNEP